jgi:hypothetical protein
LVLATIDGQSSHAKVIFECQAFARVASLHAVSFGDLFDIRGAPVGADSIVGRMG